MWFHFVVIVMNPNCHCITTRTIREMKYCRKVCALGLEDRYSNIHHSAVRKTESLIRHGYCQIDIKRSVRSNKRTCTLSCITHKLHMFARTLLFNTSHPPTTKTLSAVNTPPIINNTFKPSVCAYEPFYALPFTILTWDWEKDSWTLFIDVSLIVCICSYVQSSFCLCVFFV